MTFPEKDCALNKSKKFKPVGQKLRNKYSPSVFEIIRNPI